MPDVSRPEDRAGLRVMVVDDHPMWREGVERDLTEAGFTIVASAGTGEAAINRFGATQPDVVVLDLQMPEMSGFIAAEVIRRDTNVAVLAALTGLSGMTVREQAEKAGFDLYFSMGVGYGELSAALIALARERRRGR